MKKTIAILTVLLVMAVLFASCSHGGGSSDGAAKVEAVKVSLALGGDVVEAAQKAISLAGGVDETSFTFWYKAEPQWESALTIQGGTGYNAADGTYDFVQLTGKTFAQMTATDGVSLGYFTKGIWKFDVEVRNSTGNTIIYKANSTFTGNPVSIGTAAVLLQPTMELNTTGTKAKVTFKIAVPKISASTDLTLAYGSEADAFSTITAPEAKKPTGAGANDEESANNWLYFKKEISLDAGKYDFVLSYKEGAARIGGAIVSMTLLPGVTDYVVWGTLENGEYQIASLRLVIDPVVTLTLTPSITPVANIVTVAKNGTLTFAGAPTPSTATLAWFINGVAAPSANIAAASGNTPETLTVPTGTPGVYEVVCKATSGNAVKYKSQIVIVTP